MSLWVEQTFFFQRCFLFLLRPSIGSITCIICKTKIKPWPCIWIIHRVTPTQFFKLISSWASCFLPHFMYEFLPPYLGSGSFLCLGVLMEYTETWSSAHSGNLTHVETGFHCLSLDYSDLNCHSSYFVGFPGSSDGKESACNVGDLGSIPGLGRSPGGGYDNPH